MEDALFVGHEGLLVSRLVAPDVHRGAGYARTRRPPEALGQTRVGDLDLQRDGVVRDRLLGLEENDVASQAAARSPRPNPRNA